MRKDNCVYASVVIDWENITFPLVEGSPISSAGVVANNENAFGLVPVTYTKRPVAGIDAIDVIIGGDVDKKSIAFNDGELDDAVVQKLTGIRFYEDDVHIASGGSGGGAFVIGETYADDAATLNKTWKEIRDAMADGKIAIIDSRVEGNIAIDFCYVATNIGDGAKPYMITTLNGNAYYAETQNDYPSTSSDDGGGGDDNPPS